MAPHPILTGLSIIGIWFPVRRGEERPAGLGKRGLNRKLGFQKFKAELCVTAN